MVCGPRHLTAPLVVSVLLSLAPGTRRERPPLSEVLYAAVVTRSHWIQLQEAATPALGYVVGEDSPAKPAADKV